MIFIFKSISLFFLKIFVKVDNDVTFVLSEFYIYISYFPFPNEIYLRHPNGYWTHLWVVELDVDDHSLQQIVKSICVCVWVCVCGAMISLAQQTVFGRDTARIKCEGVGPPFDDMNAQTAVFPPHTHTHLVSFSHTHSDWALRQSMDG